MIAAANEALRVQRSLEHEVTALQQTMLSMQNQSHINSSAISGYQEGAFVVGKSLVEKERKDLCIIRSIMVHYVVKEVFRMQKFSAEDVSNIMLFVLQTSLFLSEVLLMFSNVYLSI